jgi:hypothetical protein
MKSSHSFPKQVGTALLVSCALAAYPLARFGSAEIVVAVAAGALVSTANVLIGYLAIEYSFERSYTTFLKAVIGGMGLRMLAMVLALLALIKIAGLHALALTISLLSFYFVFLVLEVFFIQRKVVTKTHN